MPEGLDARLRAELEQISALTEEDRGRLLELFVAARNQKRAALDTALDELLVHLPRMLRGPAKRIVFGGER